MSVTDAYAVTKPLRTTHDIDEGLVVTSTAGLTLDTAIEESFIADSSGTNDTGDVADTVDVNDEAAPYPAAAGVSDQLNVDESKPNGVIEELPEIARIDGPYVDPDDSIVFADDGTSCQVKRKVTTEEPLLFHDCSRGHSTTDSGRTECTCSVDQSKIHDEEPTVSSTTVCPEMSYDVDDDIKRGILRTCERRIEDNYSVGRIYGLEVVVDTDTAYFNASNVIPDKTRLDELMNSGVMRVGFEYVRDRLKRPPYYHVSGKINSALNGVYMHGMTAGNVLGNALADRGEATTEQCDS